jgi:hypothetical protein
LQPGHSRRWRVDSFVVRIQEASYLESRAVNAITQAFLKE